MVKADRTPAGPAMPNQLVVTTGVTDINGVTMADEYHASLVISR